ncbi:MAG: hypothetical protein HFH80_01205 [Lachnospiraceae bacterium]|nr:hypothetical protein [Lachnospiraceae bacterium]
MDKNSVLYQLMAMRLDSAINSIAERDEDYQASLSAVDKYIDQLKALPLPKETQKLVNDCMSGHIAIGSCWGRLAYLQGFSDCRELLLKPLLSGKEDAGHGLL